MHTLTSLHWLLLNLVIYIIPLQSRLASHALLLCARLVRHDYPVFWFSFCCRCCWKYPVSFPFIIVPCLDFQWSRKGYVLFILQQPTDRPIVDQGVMCDLILMQSIHAILNVAVYQLKQCFMNTLFGVLILPSLSYLYSFVWVTLFRFTYDYNYTTRACRATQTFCFIITCTCIIWNTSAAKCKLSSKYIFW